FAIPEPQLAMPEPLPEPLYVRLADILVILSATLVSLAGGAWLIAQLGIELSHAILAALGTYCVLLLVHVLARRSLRPQVADETAPVEDESDGHWQTGAEAFDAALARQMPQAPHAGEPEVGTHPVATEGAAPHARHGAWAGALPLPEPKEDSEA